MSFEISIGDFLLDNFVGPLLTDITNSALAVLGSSLGSLISSIGKRQIDFSQFLNDNILGPLVTDVSIGLNDFLSQSIATLSQSLIASLLG